MRCGEAKCVGWKDLFPPVLNLLSDYQKVMFNGLVTTGSQFRHQCIQSLMSMKWPSQILTPIAMMFRWTMRQSKIASVSMYNSFTKPNFFSSFSQRNANNQRRTIKDFGKICPLSASIGANRVTDFGQSVIFPNHKCTAGVDGAV